jgi:DNA-binding NtrC family response regulator
MITPNDNPGGDRHPALLLLSADEQLRALVAATAADAWRVEHLRDPARIADAVRLSDLRLVLLDDETVAEQERGWLLAQLRRHLPGAPLLYVAGHHDGLVEKRARAGGAHYYTSKPIHPDEFAGILKSFLRFHH